MEETNLLSIQEIFSDSEEHRVGPQHLLIDMLVITVLASICDAQN